MLGVLLNFIKKIVFWPRIRKYRIIHVHRKTAEYCNRLIKSYDDGDIAYNLLPKKVLKDKKIIWQYWGQGFEDSEIPLLVRKCLSSVDKYCDTDEYEIIRLSDKNFSEYVDFPKCIVDKLEKIPKAFFSDLLRCCLLSIYGGCWLDTTVLLTGRISERYWKQNFFLFQRDNSECNKEYWENAFAYYYGWGEEFKVKVLSSVFFSHRGNEFVVDLRNILLFFLEKNNKLPTYFFFQILFNELLEVKYKNFNCVLEGDCIPHYLQQILNDDNFHIASLEETLKLTTIHKLTYKIEGNYERLVKLLDEYYLSR